MLPWCSFPILKLDIKKVRTQTFNVFKIIKNINFSHCDFKFKMVLVNRPGTRWSTDLGSRCFQLKVSLIRKTDSWEFTTVSMSGVGGGGVRVMQATGTQVLPPRELYIEHHEFASGKVIQERARWKPQSFFMNDFEFILFSPLWHDQFNSMGNLVEKQCNEWKVHWIIEKNLGDCLH